MDRRSNTVSVRQRRLFGIDGTERVMADLTTLVLRLAAGQKVTEGDVHLARLKVMLLAYTDRQSSEFELGVEKMSCAQCVDEELEA